MGRSFGVLAGGVLALLGLLWILQGLDAFHQTGGMNGQPIWAVIGAVLVVVGGVLVWRGSRRRPRVRR